MPITDTEYVDAYRLDARRLKSLAPGGDRHASRAVQSRHGARRFSARVCRLALRAPGAPRRRDPHGRFRSARQREKPLAPSMEELLIKGGRVVDPANRFDGLRDVRISAGIVAEIGEHLTAARRRAGHRRRRLDRRTGVHRHARALARARPSRKGDDRDRYGGRGARRLYQRGLHAEHDAGARCAANARAAPRANRPRGSLPRLPYRRDDARATGPATLRLRSARARGRRRVLRRRRHDWRRARLRSMPRSAAARSPASSFPTAKTRASRAPEAARRWPKTLPSRAIS